MGKQPGSFGASLVDVNRGWVRGRFVERVWPPEAAEAKHQRVGRETSCDLLQLFHGFGGVAVERERDRQCRAAEHACSSCEEDAHISG
jgi:hypothetical protein